MTESLRVRVGAVTLVLVTIAAVVFGVINFRQRTMYDMADDGVTWRDTPSGVEAKKIAPNSPAVLAGIKPGDRLISINDNPMHNTTDVTQRLWRVGMWTEVRYQLSRDGSDFTARLVTAPAEKPLAYENFLRIVGLAYLFIGFFIFARRWTAPRALHFYIFCLVSFIFYSFHYSGKLNAFDQVILFANTAAWFLQPALLLHFALVFPERHSSPWRLRGILALVYGVPAALGALYVLSLTGSLGFVFWLGSRIELDQIRLVYLGAYFLLAALVFLSSFRRAPSGILRQQLKWACFGTLAVTPFVFTYIPLFIKNDGDVPAWAKTSTVLLVLLPLCFAYAIIRYRLMDVDIIFKRGLAYTAATAGVVAVYFLVIGGVAEFSHIAVGTGTAGGMIAIILTAFLLQPFRDWIQKGLDRFFYRDRLDYRRTLIEFGRTLTNEVHLEPMLGSVMDRISQTLLVDRMAIFLVDESTGKARLARSLGMGSPESTDSLD